MKIAFIILLLVSSIASAAKYAGEFLMFNPDVRSMSMGMTGVCETSSVGAFHKNPASIAFLKDLSVSTQYSSIFGSVSDNLAYYHYAGIVVPYKSLDAAIGFNWIRLAVDDIPYFPDYSDVDRWKKIEENNGEPYNPDGNNYFSDREDAFFISIAKRIKTELDLGWAFFTFPLDISAGFNFKYINIALADRSATGFGFDGGLICLVDINKVSSIRGLNPIKLGFSITDFNKTGISWSDTAQDAIPIRIRTGAEYVFPLKFIKTDITTSYDFHYETEIENSVDHWGLELKWFDMISLRIGTYDSIVTYGGGVSYLGFSLDYGFRDSDLGAVNKISLSYNFNDLLDF
ncbi:MAG: hypothetical protein JXR48_04570 [Candidatus Delongbacteria bacterium]|nr:hypothetical protein [Candidatus Delongbacteria bacterium]MBN2834222.1 hypothetical protein [Candidatus Delongbacteria bacterium]